MTSAPYPWQQFQWQQQRTLVSQGGLPQALLIAGACGIGKADFARALAQLSLCHQPDEMACGACSACRTFQAGGQADWIEIRRAEDKKEILIDQIREFCASIQLTANSSAGRYALIHEADKLSRNAANALLKTLEEPPAGVHILLTAEQLSRIPATIRSRCQRLMMPRPTAELAREWLGNDFADVPDELIARLGPVALKTQQAQLKDLQRQQRDWAELLDTLKNELDPLKAAASIAEKDFDDFISWWQKQLLHNMKSRHNTIVFRRMWDAMLKIRRQGQGGNLNRLLALEGLFILYTELLQQARS